jgi:hypothetical protein
MSVGIPMDGAPDVEAATDAGAGRNRSLAKSKPAVLEQDVSFALTKLHQHCP